ncbi:MAG: glutamate formimidoyltransferase [Bryobacterales bacterium]|nr:glutamate formimidoyltransferase [Bryobacterales bacterium]
MAGEGLAQLIECVANFSEGRDLAVIDALVESLHGVALLDRTSDPDHHRSVLTFAGAPDAVAAAAFQAVRTAAARIDLTRHTGIHPRIGAADVIPLVPIAGVTLDECAALAVGLGERIWSELHVPVYLYEAAARRPGRRRLEVIRRGGFELLRHEALTREDRAPDIGGPALHPTAGATVVGARPFLIAFNINLDTGDVAVARTIAARIRESSGGLPCVKAMGVFLASRGLAQVTMNLTDFTVTPVHRAYEAVRDEAEHLGVRVLESELIGLIPRAALAGSEPWLPTVRDFDESRILENRLRSALP